MEDSFKLLEEKIKKAATRLKELRAANETLQGELDQAHQRAEKAEKKLEKAGEAEGSREGAAKKADGLAREVKALKKEREEIRDRLGRLLELLESLE